MAIVEPIYRGSGVDVELSDASGNTQLSCGGYTRAFVQPCAQALAEPAVAPGTLLRCRGVVDSYYSPPNTVGAATFACSGGA